MSANFITWAVTGPHSIGRRGTRHHSGGRLHTLRTVHIYRCPRCRAEDISADAHPARILSNGTTVPVLVCRSCYRPSELEYRIACDAAAVPYAPLGARDGLRLLRDFYLDRLAEWRDPDLLLEDDERERGAARIRAALAEVDRRARIAPVDSD